MSEIVHELHRCGWNAGPRWKITEDGCWEWAGTPNAYGYGVVAFEGRRFMAHRVMYQLLVGRIGAQQDLDHLCTNRLCVNPEHLEPVTRRENLLRAIGKRLPHCRHGHLFDDENTYVNAKGYRFCKECRRLSAQRLRDRKRAEVSS